MTASRIGPLPALTERAAIVVDLLIRLGIILTDVVRDIFPGLSDEAARKFLDRLVADGWLSRHRFPIGGSYYVLSDSACHRFGLKRSGRPLRQRPLIKRCLVLFHFAANPNLRLLTGTECRELLPAIYRRGASNQFFIDSAANALGWICLDDGKQPKRMHFKVQQTAAKKRTLDELRSLSSAGRFRILVLTTTEEKAAQLHTWFIERPIRDVSVEIVAVPQCKALVLS